ncbi:MAG: hypothetical protein EXX96DRAFT_584429 [Benjaminiella poitrasii]|nr:MAG: hypothetical protein EXX96DRAFT_584429 [Benjaminiella poitrasii]
MSHQMQNVFIKFYEPLPEESITLPVNQLEQFLADAPSKYGVAWVFHIQRDGVTSDGVTSDGPSTSVGHKKRGPKPKNVWSRTYFCHRGGVKQTRKDVNRGGSSGYVRHLQKPSKKIGCTAKLKVTCYLDDPNTITITHINKHNHNVGDTDELQHLSLSADVKKYITDRLNDGFDKRHIRLAIQRSFIKFLSNNLSFTVIDGNSYLNQIIHCNQIVHADEVYNLFYKIQNQKYQRHKSQHESVKTWLNELESQGFKTFIDDSSFYSQFTFGFLSPQQKQLLLEAKSWCLDATHNTTNIKNGLLYTIVIRHPITGTGYPVAFLFSVDGSSSPLIRFFTFLKLIVGVPAPLKITIDVSNVELDALSSVYPKAQIQWCCFHVSRAWIKKLRTTV